MYYHTLYDDMASFFQDGNGYIDEQELEALLRDLYQKNNKVCFETPDIGVISVPISIPHPSIEETKMLRLPYCNIT